MSCAKDLLLPERLAVVPRELVSGLLLEEVEGPPLEIASDDLY